jgi:hypothetical protein
MKHRCIEQDNADPCGYSVAKVSFDGLARILS